MSARAPCIIGVRHHSPACARLVAARIRALRPRHVLIEGPADFNARIDELHLRHTLPLAIYSYLSGDGTHRGSWTPFAEHSPEWQALVVGRACGAQVRFIDLPAWHDAMDDLPNRYADAPDAAHEARAEAYEAALAQRLAIDGRDALWDHLFEQQTGDDALAAALQTHFEHLRGDDPGSPGNAARETQMAQWMAWAMARNDGEVLVVCGGYHAPALARRWRELDAGDGEPDVPEPPRDEAALRHGSFLVPYSFRRLDAFQGYASGMSSPLYYQWLWESDAAGAGMRLVRDIATRLRARNLVASTADLIALHTHARGLALLRAHAEPLRADWLDAVAATLLKEAQDVALPWTYRGTIRAGTAPLLVEVMDVLAGDVRGTLARETPRPPLLDSVERELAAHGIALEGERDIDLLDERGRRESRVLHRLRLLGIPGIERLRGPALALAGERRERWRLGRPLEQTAALIEAGAYGATLADAARAMLETKLRDARSDVVALAQGLNEAALAGLAAVGDALLADLRAAIAAAPRFEELGQALAVLYPLFRHGEAVAVAGAPLLAVVIAAAYDRALWLFEPATGIAAADGFAHLRAVIALRDLVRGHAADVQDGDDGLDLEVARALAVFARKAHDEAAAPLSRGAALGALVSLPQLGDAAGEAFDTGAALALLGRLAPDAIGDALSGLLALAREQIAEDPAFVRGVDALVAALDDHDFVQALPALRSAFAWLPARERGRLASAVLRLHDAAHLAQSALTAPLPADIDAAAIARATLRERELWQNLQRWGVLPAAEEEPA
ncbi:MAG TPA: DUF5682 family protein [Tahibacter sp.]|uniref:DUF5682 family protein n=1 Tax=Tahibacter sp. TaxID=2056211 RepID=UPI002C1DE54B|nr:DUF5682 family protein [Tahibacter sp.]HSX60079.1 DUF5682 family protein [Tahibacter sp.]